jgi:hypothetical protein
VGLRSRDFTALTLSVYFIISRTTSPILESSPSLSGSEDEEEEVDGEEEDEDEDEDVTVGSPFFLCERVLEPEQ